jgi:hypothetical protein
MQRVSTYPVWIVLLHNNRNTSCGLWFYCIFLICSKLVAMLPTVQHEFGLLSWTMLIPFIQGVCTRCTFHNTDTGRHPRQCIHIAQIIQSRTAIVKCVRIITLRAALQCEDVLSDLRTSEVWTHAVVVASHQTVQGFGYVPVVVWLYRLHGSRSASKQTSVRPLSVS